LNDLIEDMQFTNLLPQPLVQVLKSEYHFETSKIYPRLLIEIQAR